MAASLPFAQQHACYERIIADYHNRREQWPDTHLLHCQRQQNLAAAIETAAQAVNHSQKIHSHQCRIGRQRLREWARHLIGYGHEIEQAADFEGLLATVEQAAHTFSGGGIGELTAYDTAHRIAEHREILPTRIHLHSGTRKGAFILVEGLTREVPVIDKEQLPAPFHKLAPTALEDILCMYAKELRACKDTGSCQLVKDSGCRPMARPKC